MDENELVPVMSSVGWQVIEIAERMLELGYSEDEICEVLDLPSVHHLMYLLSWAEREREDMLHELSE